MDPNANQSELTRRQKLASKPEPKGKDLGVAGLTLQSNEQEEYLAMSRLFPETSHQSTRITLVLWIRVRYFPQALN